MSSEGNPNECIWKPPIKRNENGVVKMLKFPCRFPDKEKTAEVCNPCLLGDLFAMQFTQMSSLKQQSAMSEEIMTFLRNMTSDGSLDDLT
ncbi:MAG: hypothetical protein ACXAE3_01080 [Candidatus Kariarchaeaceae archaeon]|jgi:hypothetical protein